MTARITTQAELVAALRGAGEAVTCEACEGWGLHCAGPAEDHGPDEPSCQDQGHLQACPGCKGTGREPPLLTFAPAERLDVAYELRKLWLCDVCDGGPINHGVCACPDGPRKEYPDPPFRAVVLRASGCPWCGDGGHCLWVGMGTCQRCGQEHAGVFPFETPENPLCPCTAGFTADLVQQLEALDVETEWKEVQDAE